MRRKRKPTLRPEAKRFYAAVITVALGIIALAVIHSYQWLHGLFVEYFLLMVWLISRAMRDWAARKGFCVLAPASVTIVLCIVLYITTMFYICGPL